MENEVFGIVVSTLITATIVYRSLRRRLPWFYDRYINSARWRRRSRFCRQLANGKCRTKGCPFPAHVAHHKSYRFLASWTPLELIDLVALCKSCHMGLHRVEGGRRRQRPNVKRDVILRQVTDDWVSGRIKRGIAA